MPTETRLDRSRLLTAVDGRRDAFARDLRTLVEIPSVSSDDTRKPDVARCARAAADLVRAHGGRAEVVTTAGNPIVVGELGDEGPLVAVYNHLDVQPAEEGKDGWTRAPFAFSEEGGRWYGRGSTDDKGPAVTALHAAALAREHGVPVRVRFVWELEEEIGSPSFAGFLGGHGARLKPDSVLVSDTIWLAEGKPAVAYGLRGLVGALLRLRTAGKDAHSGLTGGAARNPIAELAEVITGCVDARTGAIKIEGFDRTWQPVSEAEARDFVDSGFSVDSFRRAHRLEKLRATDPAEVTQRIWGRPTFEVHGIAGGFQGQGVKTVVPPEAEAKVSLRLVPPQDPEEVLALLTAHVKRLNPDVEVVPEGRLRAYLGQRTGPYADAAADALQFGFGARPAFVREGGSIGAVLAMAQAWDVPITLLGLSLPEDGYHGPDESFAWGQARGGMLTFVRYFEQLSALQS